MWLGPVGPTTHCAPLRHHRHITLHDQKLLVTLFQSLVTVLRCVCTQIWISAHVCVCLQCMCVYVCVRNVVGVHVMRSAIVSSTEFCWDAKKKQLTMHWLLPVTLHSILSQSLRRTGDALRSLIATVFEQHSKRSMTDERTQRYWWLSRASVSDLAVPNSNALTSTPSWEKAGDFANSCPTSCSISHQLFRLLIQDLNCVTAAPVNCASALLLANRKPRMIPVIMITNDTLSDTTFFLFSFLFFFYIFVCVCVCVC